MLSGKRYTPRKAMGARSVQTTITSSFTRNLSNGWSAVGTSFRGRRDRKRASKTPIPTPADLGERIRSTFERKTERNARSIATRFFYRRAAQSSRRPGVIGFFPATNSNSSVRQAKSTSERVEIPCRHEKSICEMREKECSRELGGHTTRSAATKMRSGKFLRYSETADSLRPNLRRCCTGSSQSPRTLEIWFSTASSVRALLPQSRTRWGVGGLASRAGNRPARIAYSA